MPAHGWTMVAMSKRRGPWLGRLRRYEVFVRYGDDDDQGIPSGGAEWVGMYFTLWGARRILARQKWQPGRPLPQVAEILKLGPRLSMKAVVETRRL